MTADLQPSSVLSDATIRELIESGRIVIDPWDPAMVQPASVDIRLGNSFRVFHNHRIQSIDLSDPPRDLTEHVEIDDDGQFVIHPGEFVLGRTHELVEIPDDVVCRIEGKALALDTDIATPGGWTTMGEIEVGDQVFGPGGSPRCVVAATDVMHGRACFEVTFSDGTRVVADAEHQWRVLDRYRRWPQVLTTRSMVEAGIKAGQRDYRFRVPEAWPVECSERDLPVHPYVFGVWIGDGTSTNANVTCYDDPILREVELAGYTVRRVNERRLYNVGGAALARDPRTGRYTGNGSLHTTLKTQGLLGAKTATLDGKACGLKYDVTFTPDMPVFRLPRKLARQKTEGKLNFCRSIVGICEVPSVPVRCIQVDHPDGLYLITKRYLTTHNSSIGRLGLVVHATAGFVDPGFRGTLTLEIANFNSVPIVLRPGLPICQLSFMALDRPAERPYGHPDLGSHYYGQVDATESRYRS